MQDEPNNMHRQLRALLAYASTVAEVALCGSDARLDASLLITEQLAAIKGSSILMRRSRKRQSRSALRLRLLFLLVNTRSITRIFATASASGVGTGAVVEDCAGEGVGLQCVLVAEFEANLFDRRARLGADRHPQRHGFRSGR